MYKTAEELCASIEKCFHYFVGQGKSFSFWIDDTAVRFKVGDKEMKKDLEDRSLAEWYVSALSALFENEAKKKTLQFHDLNKKVVYFAKKLLDNKTNETINKG